MIDEQKKKKVYILLFVVIPLIAPISLWVAFKMLSLMGFHFSKKAVVVISIVSIIIGYYSVISAMKRVPKEENTSSVIN